MALFDKITRVVSDTSQSVVNKTRELGELAKLSSKVSDLERRESQLYKTIGKLYVEHYGDDPDEVFVAALDSLKETKKRIAGYKAEIKRLKGVGKCSSCGADVEPGHQFCCKCGAKVEPADVVADVDAIFADEEEAYADAEEDTAEDIERMSDCEVEEE